MTAATAPDLSTLLGLLQGAATDLDDPGVIALVTGLIEHNRAPRPLILIAGTTGSGRSTILDVIARAPDLLPRSGLPKLPIPVMVRHGSAERAELHREDGLTVPVPVRNLRAALLGRLADSPRPTAIDVFGVSDLLALCDLRIEPLETFRTDEDWQELLTRCDFVFLVLNATSLLSQHERSFVRDYLAESFGLQRVAILVNQIDRVSEEERGAVLDHVRGFLGSFAAQPAILTLSAEQLVHELRSGSSPSEEMEALDQMVGDLTEHGAALRERTMVAGAMSALRELELSLARSEALLLLDATRIEELRTALRDREGELSARASRVQQRVQTFVGALIREQLLREVSTFGDMLRRRLPDDVRAVGDVGTARRHLPGYLETVWTEFLDRQMIATGGKLADEALAVGRMIETDLREVLGEELVNLRDVLGDFDPTDEALRTVVMPKRSKHYAAGLAKGLSLHGYIMLIFNPPLGVISLAASHIVQRAFRSQITGSQIEELIGSAISAERELEDEIAQRIGAQFGELVDDLRTEIVFVYRRAVAGLEAALTAELENAATADSRRTVIEDLRAVGVPQIRATIELMAEGRAR